MPHLLSSGILLLLTRKSTAIALGSLLLCHIGSMPDERLQIFSDTFGMLAQLHDELDDEQEMLPLGQMGLMMVDWLDPRKAV